MLRPVPFYYLRHGQTDWNRDRLCQGDLDIPLNATGEAQARAAAILLNNEPIASICVSPLQRARRTAEIVNETLRVPMIVIDELREICDGAHQGLFMEAGFYEARRGGTLLPDGAESLDAIHARALAAMNAALDHPGPVLVVSHGGLYWGVEHHTALLGPTLPHGAPVFHGPPDAAAPAWVRRHLGP